MRISLGVVVILVLSIAGLGCEKSNRNNRNLPLGHTAAVTFPPHPGKVVFRSAWDHGEKTMSANEIPDTNKFVYYAADGSETSDTEHAAKRIPILEVDMVSVDKDGKLVDPKKAASITVTEYGPDHHELRHTTGHPPPQP